MSADNVKVDLALTEYGERMALSLYLPDNFSFDPGDGAMALRLECFNSVDGSSRFRALMGWFRFVCSNGLIVGVTRSDLRRRHVGDLRLSDLSMVVSSGLKETESEKRNFRCWRKAEVTLDRLTRWVNKELREGWGFKAAARTFHIACTGIDAEIVGQYKDNTPTSRNVSRSINCCYCDLFRGTESASGVHALLGSASVQSGQT
jgi:uncharacterized protein DUF932